MHYASPRTSKHEAGTRTRQAWARGAGLWLALALITVLAACSSSTRHATQTAVIPTATSGQVTLSLDRAAYHANDPIGITVSNTGTSLVYARDGMTGCTYLQLQRYDTARNAWSNSGTCTSLATATVLLLEPGVMEPFTFAPGVEGNENTWPTGVYRIALTYSANADGRTGAQTAYSAGVQL